MQEFFRFGFHGCFPFFLCPFSHCHHIYVTNFSPLPPHYLNGSKSIAAYSPKARAVFPVPGGPASKTALPAIRLVLIISTMMPEASRANSWPTKPADAVTAKPFSSKPKPGDEDKLMVNWTEAACNGAAGVSRQSLSLSTQINSAWLLTKRRNSGRVAWHLRASLKECPSQL